MSWEGQVDLAADAVVFHVSDSGKISLLLIKRKDEPFKNRWALPGGVVEPREHTEVACERELAEETSLVATFEDNTWTPLSVRAHPFRDPRGRVVSFPYAILLRGVQPPVRAADDAKEVRWWPLRDVLAGDLAFDHIDIVREAATLYKLDTGQ